MMWEAMIREFERHKLRTILTMLGVMIGIFLVTSVSSFSEGITYYVNDQLAITSGLVFVIEADVPSYAMATSEIDEEVVEELEGISGVEAVAPIIFKTLDGYSVTATRPEDEDIIRGVNIEIGEGREFEGGKNEIVVGYNVAERENFVGGDVIKLEDEEFEVVGILQESGDTDVDNAVHMHLKDLQELVDMEGKVNILMIKPLTPTDADYIEQAINDDYDDIHAMSDKSIMNSVNEMLGQLNVMTFALGSIAALISGIVIMNVMIISVRERRRDIGTMKAVGATNRQILLSILLEAVSISVGGAIVGVFLAFGGAAFLNSVLFQPLALVTPRLIMQGILFAAFIGVVSGILPARQAAKLSPIEALRYE